MLAPEDIFEQYSQDEVGYLKNPKIKKPGVKIPMTAAQVTEFGKCARSAEYFIENYMKTITLDDGITGIKLWNFQKKAIKTYQQERFVIFKCPRQQGKTTITVGFILWFVLFQKAKTVGVLAQKEKTALEILGRIKMAYEQLPMWIQQGVVEWNKQSIRLENDCRILAEATASGAIRGFTINLLYLDEFAHVPPNIAEDFFTAVYPTISSGKTSKIILTSTPNGLNLFYRFWMDAIKKDTDPKHWNGFHAISARWQDVPGRDQAWADQQKAILKGKYEQEIETEFLGSSGTLIDGRTLRNLAHINPIQDMLDNKFQMYEQPITGHLYVLSADPSKGTGLDYSTFSVFDVTTSPWRVVGKFRDNKTDELIFPNYIQQAAMFYNNAYVIIENNEMGALVAHNLVYELEYDNVFYSMADSNAEVTASQSGKAKVIGLKATKKSKMQGCQRLKTLIETQQLIVQDFDCISELSTFVLKKNGQYAAEETYHDDMVSNLWLFAWLTAQPVFKDVSDVNLRERLFDAQTSSLAEQMPPSPIIEDAKNQGRPMFDIWQGAVFIPADVDYNEALRILNGEDH